MSICNNNERDSRGYRVHKVTLRIAKPIIDEFDENYSKEKVDLADLGWKKFDVPLAWSIEFDDGKTFDLRICTGDDEVWNEGILVDGDYELEVADEREHLAGEYVFYHRDNKYVVVVAPYESREYTISCMKDEYSRLFTKRYVYEEVKTKGRDVPKSAPTAYVVQDILHSEPEVVSVFLDEGDCLEWVNEQNAKYRDYLRNS